MKFLIYIHSHWAIIFLLIFTVTVIKYIRANIFRVPYTKTDLHLAIFTMVSGGIQVFIGLAVYFSSSVYKYLKHNGIKAVMNNIDHLHGAILHPLLELFSFGLLYAGYRAMLVSENSSLHKSMLKYYLPAFLIMVAIIPWGKWLF